MVYSSIGVGEALRYSRHGLHSRLNGPSEWKGRSHRRQSRCLSLRSLVDGLGRGRARCAMSFSLLREVRTPVRSGTSWVLAASGAGPYSRTSASSTAVSWAFRTTGDRSLVTQSASAAPGCGCCGCNSGNYDGLRPLTPDAAPPSMWARFITAQRADLAVTVLIQQHVAVRTKVLIGGYAGTRDVEKAHHTLLPRGSQELLSGWLDMNRHSEPVYEHKTDAVLLMVGLSR